MFVGYRTVIIGLLWAILPTALNYLVGIDWSKFMSTQTATLVGGVLMLLMRVVTKTAVGTK